MKKHIIFFVLTAIIMVIAACGSAHSDEENVSKNDCIFSLFSDGIGCDLFYFRAEVLEAAPYFARAEDTLLFVSNMTPMWENQLPGRYFLQGNDVIVLDNLGKNILVEDIAPGAVIDVIARGSVLLSDPGVIPLVVAIQVVDQ